MDVDYRVLELLTSRLCHDLISPVGAVGNGLELLEEGDSGMEEDALRLCMRSQRRAAVLLQAFRLAHGANQGVGGVAEARQRGTGLLEDSKTTLDWPAAAGDPQAPPGTARLVLNLVILAAECLPRGGAIRVTLAPSAGVTEVRLEATGQDARLAEGVEPALRPDSKVEELTPRTVQAYLTARLAERLGGRLDFVTGTGQLSFRARLEP